MNRRPFVVNRESDTEHVGSQGPSLATVIAEIKNEIKDFVQTRVQMFKSELQEKTSAWKSGAMLATGAVVLLGTAYLLLTLALVGLLAVAFWGSVYHWFFGFLIVGLAWALIGGMLGYFALREFRAQGLAPKKTLEVLKEDKVWLESEASQV